MRLTSSIGSQAGDEPPKQSQFPMMTDGEIAPRGECQEWGPAPFTAAAASSRVRGSERIKASRLPRDALTQTRRQSASQVLRACPGEAMIGTPPRGDHEYASVRLWRPMTLPERKIDPDDSGGSRRRAVASPRFLARAHRPLGSFIESGAAGCWSRTPCRRPYTTRRRDGEGPRWSSSSGSITPAIPLDQEKNSVRSCRAAARPGE